ncbi:MFS transporter [Palleronia caenipelagi]|uniref:MFS transporter n=2 Tax=Palleronia caenipelagi TaxID=2489174 RepID=A0A547PJY9_9RHOB|nr:MFS transporter [Palleronia caenipelagi]
MRDAQSRHAHINFVGLIAANTILVSVMPMLIIIGGLAGLLLAPSPEFATLPPSVQTFAGLIATGPFSLLMGRYGRRVGFVIGGLAASAGGAIGVFALLWSSFVLLCVAHAFLGAALACYLYFRFAAAEVVASDWQPISISIMLSSGLVAAFVGPQVFIWTKDVFAPVPLAGAYAAITCVTLVGLVPLVFVRIPRPTMTANRATLDRAAIGIILKRRPVLIAVLASAVSQGIMVLLMAPTPLAMTEHGYSETLASDVVRWHVVAMFAPSFFTGFLIRRFGSVPIVATGLALLTGAALIAASGISVHHFYVALVVLGIGWNFGFIGATNLLSTAISPEERSVVQGTNDTLIAFAATLCVFASGAIVTGFGWTELALSSSPLLAVALIWILLSRQMAEPI